MNDVARTADYRQLHFASLADIRADLAQLERAHRAGTLRTSGNWTPGQNLAHLAAFITYGFDGYPPQLSSPPWLIVLILKLLKKRYLYKALPRGVKIPKVEGGTVGNDPVPFEEGFSRLETALARLERAAPARPNPIFGPLTHDEWKSLHMRHCELHLGYLHPR